MRGGWWLWRWSWSAAWSSETGAMQQSGFIPTPPAMRIEAAACSSGECPAPPAASSAAA
uniref:Uncharacterized protein n=1 Tax=Arundo donax TaxID=35708 RepID=A0A0A9HQF1_ARUDO